MHLRVFREERQDWLVRKFMDLLYHFSIHCRVKVTREDSGLVPGTSPLSRLHDGMMHGDKSLKGFTREDLLHTEK